jgi:VanZ family protein
MVYCREYKKSMIPKCSVKPLHNIFFFNYQPEDILYLLTLQTLSLSPLSFLSSWSINAYLPHELTLTTCFDKLYQFHLYTYQFPFSIIFFYNSFKNLKNFYKVFHYQVFAFIKSELHF